MSVDQDLNCRTVGRCTHGELIDRELLDLVCREAEDHWTMDEVLAWPQIPLGKDLGRAFVYARYNVDLSKEGLKAMGLGQINPQKVQKLDAVDQIDNLLAIGRTGGKEVSAEHFKTFL